jgi:hypothetical protein
MRIAGIAVGITTFIVTPGTGGKVAGICVRPTGIGIRSATIITATIVTPR